MNYNFFADKEDKLKLLQYIFDETDLQIFDCYSEPEQTICSYRDPGELRDKFDLQNIKGTIALHLWSPRFSDQVIIEKITLDPSHCDGKTFRYMTCGLGLIQFYLRGLDRNTLEYSHIGHRSEKGALNAEASLPFWDKAANWHWAEIQKTSRKLKNTIHKNWAVDSIGSLGVMPGAHQLDRQGIKMSFFQRS